MELKSKKIKIKKNNSQQYTNKKKMIKIFFLHFTF